MNSTLAGLTPDRLDAETAHMKPERIMWHLSLLVIALVVFFPATSQADSLRIVTEAWPPHVFQDEDRITGSDYEVAVAVLNAMGTTVSLEFFPWKRCISMVEEGGADALLDAGKTEAREKTMHFPKESLSSSETVLFHRSDRELPFHSFNDLTGLTIGTQLGYSYSEEFKNAKGFRKVPVNDIRLNIRKVLTGRIDAYVANRNYGLFVARQLNVLSEVRHTAKVISGGDVYLAFSKETVAPDFVAAFSRTLKRFKETDEYRTILSRYGQ